MAVGPRLPEAVSAVAFAAVLQGLVAAGGPDSGWLGDDPDWLETAPPDVRCSTRTGWPANVSLVYGTRLK